MTAAVFESDPRSGAKIADRSRHQCFAGRGYCGNARCGVDGDAGDVAAHRLDLSGMQAAAQRNAERGDFLRDRQRATNRARGAVEGREKAVTGGKDLLITVSAATTLLTVDIGGLEDAITGRIAASLNVQ